MLSDTLIAIWDVPALPGATKSLEHLEDCNSFHASACSLPPEPSSKIVIFCVLFGKNNGFKAGIIMLLSIFNYFCSKLNTTNYEKNNTCFSINLFYC